MTQDQPNRLDRIEAILANVATQQVAQSNTIDVLVANIQQLTENVAAVNQRVDALTTNVAEVTNRVDTLATQAELDRAQAAQDRQQAAIDRQEFRNEIQRIWEYLLRQGGNGNTPV